ncbi:hypothetical protein [Aureimonas frigidaquae]|uniref:hypothetical protein n=1 Tax=Aureimonas frigidaquae TaxID=424757 RepID=UPI0007833FBA|nr:hypothetical protein [Aureimonas frigidaquae]
MAGPWERYGVEASGTSMPSQKPWERRQQPRLEGTGQFGGAAMNATAGANEALYAIAGAPVDAARGIRNLAARGINATFGTEIEPLAPNVGLGSRGIAETLGAIRPELDPANTVADGMGDQLARGAGAGVVGAVVPAGVLGAANRAGMLSPQVAQTATTIFGPSNSLGRVAADAVVGGAAGAGAVAGADMAPDGWEPVGALAGSFAAGLPAGAVANAPSAIARNRAADQAVAPVGISGRTAAQISREMERDGLSVSAARQRAAQMGDDAMLLDLGDNLGRGTAAMVTKPGEGAATVRRRLADRQAGAPQRIADAADTALGPARNMAETVDDLIRTRSAAAEPLYRGALDRPIEWNDRMQQFIDEPNIRRGLRDGVEIQRLEALARGEQFNPLDLRIAGYDEAGDAIIQGTPNMRTLNAAKKGLDQQIETYRDPTTGRLALDERGRALVELQSSFIRALDDANPEYAAARQAWSGPTRVRDAMALGQDVFSASTRPDDLRRRLSSMTDAEREAFQIGARDQLAEVMGTARRDASAARALFEKGWNREKLGLVLGDDDRATQFLQTLQNETAFSNRSNAITGGSATAERQSRGLEYEGKQDVVLNALDPATGLWGDTKRTVGKGADVLLNRRSAGRAEQMRTEFGDAVSRRGPERDELIDAIFGYGRAQVAPPTLDPQELIRAIMAGATSTLITQP